MKRAIRENLLGLVVFLLSVTAVALHPAQASVLSDFLEETYLVDIRPETDLSDVVAGVRRGGYDLSGGEFKAFQRWYDARWMNMRVDFMTQITERFGLLWGLSTGEVGEKYWIEPSLRVGLIFVTQPTPQSVFSVSLTTTFSGYLREKKCVADYGAVGGVEPVNCRLAATTLEPSDTLKHLWKVRPADHTRASFRFQVAF